MATIRKTSGNFSVSAYQGDMKTLLAFNFSDTKGAKNLAGFTIQCTPQGVAPYFLQNNLRFETPGNHAQNAQEPATSSINAPIHKFRWLHVPGSVHQGAQPVVGAYTYVVTPRYFDGKQSLNPIDPNLGVSITVQVTPFQKNGVELGFTRGFTQSQAFDHRYGMKASIRPATDDLIFDTSTVSGTNAAGEKYTYADEYQWLGFTAREKIFSILNEVAADASLQLAMFAYDLNEPDLMALLLKLGAAGRIRMILDNASLHHSASKPTPEDQFEAQFAKKAKGAAALIRGHFARFSHDKVLIVSKGGKAVKVLTGSTNFSVTGLYVNSNHVLVFNDPSVTDLYLQLFEEAWKDAVKAPPFVKSALSTDTHAFSSAKTPKMEVTFAPHTESVANEILGGIAERIAQEGKNGKKNGSVLFAVMEMDAGTSPVYTALKSVHEQQNIFSYGISDNPGGIFLYPVGKTNGVLVTGKPVDTILPPPFSQVRTISGVGHQVHHKFVVCGFNGADPVVYCGSSNLALGGEQENGDNLLAIHDGDIATAFAIEALGLVDHFNFLDGVAHGSKAKAGTKPIASKQQAAASAGWFLSTDDKWAQPYFDAKDLHSVDRMLFG